MRKAAFLFAAALAMLASGAFAQDSSKIAGLTTDNFTLNSAQELLEICTLESAHPDFRMAMGFCYGYISGGGHFHRALTKGPDFDPIACPPDKVTHSDVVQVFESYTSDNPQYLESPAMDVLFRAANAEWPCE